jgi:hypothetical protein
MNALGQKEVPENVGTVRKDGSKPGGQTGWLTS